MKTRSLILASTLIIFIACGKNSKTLNPKSGVDKMVNIENGDFLELAITNGNGTYLVTSSDSVVATARADSNKLKIKGLTEGKAILTIIDKSQRKLNIEVNVIEQKQITDRITTMDKVNDQIEVKIGQKDS